MPFLLSHTHREHFLSQGSCVSWNAVGFLVLPTAVLILALVFTNYVMNDDFSALLAPHLCKRKSCLFQGVLGWWDYIYAAESSMCSINANLLILYKCFLLFIFCCVLLSLEDSLTSKLFVLFLPNLFPIFLTSSPLWALLLNGRTHDLLSQRALDANFRSSFSLPHHRSHPLILFNGADHHLRGCCDSVWW